MDVKIQPDEVYVIVGEAGVFFCKEFESTESGGVKIPVAYEQMQRIPGVLKDLELKKVLAIAQTKVPVPFEESIKKIEESFTKAIEMLMNGAFMDPNLVPKDGGQINNA